MITIDNYNAQTCKIDFDKLPEPLKKGHDLTKKALANNKSAYKSNDTISRVVDSYISKLNQYLKANTPVINTKAKKAPVTKTAPQKTKRDPIEVSIKKASQHSKKWAVWDIKRGALFANEKFDTIKEAEAFIKQNGLILKHTQPQNKTVRKAPPTSAKPVEMLPEEIRFIRRYVAMNGKVKTKLSVMRLLSSLQKAMLEKRIRKSSPYAKEILKIQDQLINCTDRMGEQSEISIATKDLEHYQEIASSRRIRDSIALLKRFVAIQGRSGMQDRAERLHKSMERLVKNGIINKDDPYAAKLNEAYRSLKIFLRDKKAAPEIKKSELNGIYGLLGMSDGKSTACKPKGLSGVVSSQDLLKMNFETIGLQGKFRELIGDPSVGFTAMVFGQPKSGKSTLMLEFAQELAVHHGLVLYSAIEEGYGYTLKEKIQRVGATSPRLHFAENLPVNLSPYDFVFVDSVSRAGMELEDMIKLKNRYPRTGFIFIFHSTKDGKFRGGNELAHEVDVIIEVEEGVVRASGRFNAGGELRM